MIKDLDEAREKLQELIDVQADTGNWDYSPYMFGLLNGMLLSQSILTGEDPGFGDKPAIWIEDAELLDKFNKSGIVNDE